MFDLPHVVEAAHAQLAGTELADRVQFVAGSFFEGVPRGADVYVMSNILHDWADNDALEILQQIRMAIPRHGLLRLFESVLEDGRTSGLGLQLDLHMLVVLGAKERTTDEWRTLLQRGGFELVSIEPTPAFSWLDATPT